MRGYQVRLASGLCMWELIHPKDKTGVPAKTDSGKYSIKLFIMVSCTAGTDNNVVLPRFNKAFCYKVIDPLLQLGSMETSCC